MKRTPLKRSTKRMKTSSPIMTPIRASARDQECTLRFPGVCNFRTDTTVLCHRNGAGAGMKAPDTDAAYGCYACHMVLDGQHPRPAGLSRALMLALFDEGVWQTHWILRRKGLLPALVHSVVGPTEDDRYLVVYPTPGCAVNTTVCDCGTAAQALAEAERLNAEQLAREEAIRGERALRDRRLIQNDLGGAV